MKNHFPPKPEILKELGISEDEYFRCCFASLDKWSRRKDLPEVMEFGEMPVEIRGYVFQLKDISTLEHRCSPAPEPYLAAYQAFLSSALDAARDLSHPHGPTTKEQLHDLLEALHNIPGFINNYGGWFVHENLLKELKRYDDKWADENLSLTRMLGDYLK